MAEKGGIVVFVMIILMVAGFTYVVINPAPQDLEEDVEHIYVTDALGRNVTIRLPIKRVIITGKSSWPIVSAAYMFPESKDKLWYMKDSITEADLFNKIDPNIGKKIFKGLDNVDPNVEEIAGEKPDVVILKSFLKEDIGRSLEELDIPVVYVELEDISTYLRDIRILGKVFGDEERAVSIAEYYNSSCREIIDVTSLVNEGEKADSMLLYYSTRGGTLSFNVPGPEWLQTYMMDNAGSNSLSNELTGEGWNIVSFEQIAQWDPQVLFIVTYTYDPSPEEAEIMIRNDQLWPDISAVKNNRTYSFPDDCGNNHAMGSWDSPGSRWVLGFKWMAKTLHPDLFHDIDLRGEAKYFYTNWYGLSEKDADEIVDAITGDILN